MEELCVDAYTSKTIAYPFPRWLNNHDVPLSWEIRSGSFPEAETQVLKNLKQVHPSTYETCYTRWVNNGLKHNNFATLWDQVT